MEAMADAQVAAVDMVVVLVAYLIQGKDVAEAADVAEVLLVYPTHANVHLTALLRTTIATVAATTIIKFNLSSVPMVVVAMEEHPIPGSIVAVAALVEVDHLACRTLANAHQIVSLKITTAFVVVAIASQIMAVALVAAVLVMAAVLVATDFLGRDVVVDAAAVEEPLAYPMFANAHKVVMHKTTIVFAVVEAASVAMVF